MSTCVCMFMLVGLKMFLTKLVVGKTKKAGDRCNMLSERAKSVAPRAEYTDAKRDGFYSFDNSTFERRPKRFGTSRIVFPPVLFFRLRASESDGFFFLRAAAADVSTRSIVRPGAAAELTTVAKTVGDDALGSCKSDRTESVSLSLSLGVRGNFPIHFNINAIYAFQRHVVLCGSLRVYMPARARTVRSRRRFRCFFCCCVRFHYLSL